MASCCEFYGRSRENKSGIIVIRLTYNCGASCGADPPTNGFVPSAHERVTVDLVNVAPVARPSAAVRTAGPRAVA